MIRVGDTAALRLRQLALELAPLRGEVEKPLPSVLNARALGNKALPDQLTENTTEALLGDAQDAEQLTDCHLRVTSDKMNYPMMGPSKCVLREYRVGLGSEIAVGEEQQLDPLPHLVLDGGWRDDERFYVSHIDLSCNLG